MEKNVDALCALLFIVPGVAIDQDNHEIQRYGSEAVALLATMVELHSSYTIDGSRETPASG